MTIVSHLSLYELLSKKEIIWMNAVKYRQRLKKDAWFKFRLGLNIRTSRQAQSGMGAKIYSWSTIHCGFKIRLSARKNPLSGGFSRPNLAIRKPIHRHIITCNRYQTWQRFVDQKSSFHLYHILWQQLTQRLLWSKRTNENLYLNSKEKKNSKVRTATEIQNSVSSCVNKWHCSSSIESGYFSDLTVATDGKNDNKPIPVVQIGQLFNNQKFVLYLSCSIVHLIIQS